MGNDIGPTEVGKRYLAVYLAQYVTKDLREAVELYRVIMAKHPDTREAGYSRSQIQNIAKVLVPKEKLLDAQVDLVLARFTSENPAI